MSAEKRRRRSAGAGLRGCVGRSAVYLQSWTHKRLSQIAFSYRTTFVQRWRKSEHQHLCLSRGARPARRGRASFCEGALEVCNIVGRDGDKLPAILTRALEEIQLGGVGREIGEIDDAIFPLVHVHWIPTLKTRRMRRAK